MTSLPAAGKKIRTAILCAHFSGVGQEMPAACESLLDDIEDIVSATDPKPHDRQNARQNIVPRARKRNKNKIQEEEPPADSTIPGTQKIWIRTWGCSHNNSDGEYMAGQLAAYGYSITEQPEQADLWLLNSCTVKSPAEDHFRNSIKKAQEANKKVVLSGCVPQAQPRQEYMKGLSIIGVQQIDRVVEVVEETIKGHSVRLLGQKKDNGKRLGGARLDLPKIRKNPLIEIISINTGKDTLACMLYSYAIPLVYNGLLAFEGIICDNFLRTREHKAGCHYMYWSNLCHSAWENSCKHTSKPGGSTRKLEVASEFSHWAT